MVVRKVLCVDSLFMNPEELHWIRNGPKADPDICPGHHCAPGTFASAHQCHLQVRDVTWSKYRKDDSVYASISGLKIKLDKRRGSRWKEWLFYRVCCVLPVASCRPWGLCLAGCGDLWAALAQTHGQVGGSQIGRLVDGQGDDVQPDHITLKKRDAKTQCTLEFEWFLWYNSCCSSYKELWLTFLHNKKTCGHVMVTTLYTEGESTIRDPPAAGSS